jgi:hypothetical protein
MTVTKVSIDGGAGLNIIFLETLRKMGLDFARLITPTGIPFYGIVPGKAAMLLGQITLPFMSCHSWKTSTGKVHGYTSCSRCQDLIE